MNPKNSWIYLIFAVILAGCSLTPGRAQTEPTQEPQTSAQSSSALVIEGRILPREHADLFFTTPGRVSEVLVAEGELVSKGAVLVRLDNRELVEANLAAAELELIDSQQALDKLNENASQSASQAQLEVNAAVSALLAAQEALDEVDTSDTRDDIDDARTAVTDAKEELDDAQEEFDKYADYDEDNATRKRAEDALEDAQDEYNEAVRERDRLINDLEQSRAEVALATSRLDAARRDLEKRSNGPDVDQLALAQARLKNAQAQVAAVQASLSDLELVAPFDGRVALVEVSPGENVVPNVLVVRMADFSEWYVETRDLTEIEVVEIALGQTVRIIPDALPELILTGVVESIGDSYVERAGDITYTTRIVLNETDPRLRWGMTVEIRIEPQF